MTKFIRIVAVSTLIMSGYSFHSCAQNSTPNSGTEIKYEAAAILSQKFSKKYKNGILRKNPKGYMVKFSKKDLIALIESVPDADSINLVLGSFSKSEKDGLKKKPLVIFQFRTPPSNDSLVANYYIYKVGGKLCPPPLSGCKVTPVPQN